MAIVFAQSLFEMLFLFLCECLEVCFFMPYLCVRFCVRGMSGGVGIVFWVFEIGFELYIWCWNKFWVL